MRRLIVAIAAAAFASAAHGATFPGCGTTVQACIAGAASGDTLVLATSTPIAETLQVLGKSLRIEAAPGFTPVLHGGIIAVGGDAATSFAVDGLTIAGAIYASPGKGSFQVEITNNHVHLADKFGQAIRIHSGTGGAYGEIDFSVVGNQVVIEGDGASAQCSGVFYGGVDDTVSSRGLIAANTISAGNCGQGQGVLIAAGLDENLNVLILANRISAPGTGAAVYVHGNRVGVAAQIAGNLLSDGKAGIIASASGTDALLGVGIVNNTVVFNEDGVLVVGRPDLGANIVGVVANNIVAHHSDTGLYLDSAFRLLGAVNNLVFDNKRDNFSGVGTLEADPKFLGSPADLRLAPGSPAIDSGDDNQVPPELVYDFAGEARIAGEAVDRGAYEYQGPFRPAAPSELRAEGVSTSAIQLDWLDHATNEDAFVVEQWNGAAFVTITTTARNVTTARVSGLEPETAYTFRVLARNAGGSSAASNEATAETWPPAPAAPADLVATLVGPDRVRLDWRDMSDDEESFTVEQQRGGSGGFVRVASALAGSQSLEMSGLDEGTRYGFRVRARNIGGESAPSNVAEVNTPAPCQPSETVACLGGGRFAVETAWSTPAGEQGTARVKSLTGDAASFWFFDPENVELVVKVLDGCGVNQRFWVFAAGLTHVGVRVTVTDTWTGSRTTYDNPAGRPFEAVQDTGALAVCGVTKTPAPEPPAPPATASGCADGNDAALCVQNGRFHVEALWRASDGRSGAGHAVSLSEDSGYFWFFDPANVEIVAKVVDACASFDRFWFFAGGLTDVGIELRVTDTATGVVRTYRNPVGQAYRPLQDASAFATCR